MKNSILLIIICAAVVINSGCSSKLMSFEKRKYNKGYHLDFAEKNNKRNTTQLTLKTATITQQEIDKTITAEKEHTFQQTPEVKGNNNFLAETSEKPDNTISYSENLPSKEQKKFFLKPVLKIFKGEQIKATAKHSLDKLIIKKNTAGTNQPMGTSFFSILGAIIAGGSLVALAVMLFSSWASVILTIILLSSIAVGIILLFIGANV